MSWLFLPRECPSCHRPQGYQFKDYNFWPLISGEEFWPAISNKEDTSSIKLKIPAPYCTGCDAVFLQGTTIDYASMIAVLMLLGKAAWTGCEVRFLRKFLGFTRQEHAETIDAQTFSAADVEHWEKTGLDDFRDPRLMVVLKDILKSRLTPKMPNEGDL